ncbi:MAG: HAD family hydrolase [Polyangiales bacterium]
MSALAKVQATTSSPPAATPAVGACANCRRVVGQGEAWGQVGCEGRWQPLCSESCRGQFLRQWQLRRAGAPRQGHSAESLPAAQLSAVTLDSSPPAASDHKGAWRAPQTMITFAVPTAFAALALGLSLWQTPTYLPLAGAVFSLLVAALVLDSTAAGRRRLGVLGWLVGPVGVTLVAAQAAQAQLQGHDAWIVRLGPALAAAALVLRARLECSQRAPVARAKAVLQAGLPSQVRVAHVPVEEGEAPSFVWVDQARVRAGQQVWVMPGEVVPVDGVVQAGTAELRAFAEAQTTLSCGAGTFVWAGARVERGTVRVLAGRVGDERAIVQAGRLGSQRGEPPSAWSLAWWWQQVGRYAGLVVVGSAVAGAWLLTLTSSWAQSLAVCGAVLIAAPLTAVRRVGPSLSQAASVAAFRHGIVFPTVDLLEQAGRTTVAALAWHGTVAELVPELIQVHCLHDSRDDDVLAMAAALQAAVENNPIGTAVRRAAAARQLRLPAVRRARYLPGRGVSAVSQAARALHLGNRQLLLEEGVSSADADQRAQQLESEGASVVFLALGGRVHGLLAFRYALRPSARAALQHLFDMRVEAVLLTGDHQGTASALAGLVDVSHVKAELPAQERAAEVQRLRETGRVVAAIARADFGSEILASGDVPIVLCASGGPRSVRSVSLVGDDLRTAALAIWTAQQTRRASARAMLLAVGIGGMAVVAAAAGLLVPALAALVGVLVEAATLSASTLLLRRFDERAVPLGHGALSASEARTQAVSSEATTPSTLQDAFD